MAGEFTHSDPRIDRFRGCVLGAMIGDSLGMRFDGISAGPMKHRFADLDAIVAESPGAYGAATAMTAAVVDSLAACPEFNGDDMSRRLMESFSSKRGFGQGTAGALARVREGRPWREAADAGGGRSSAGNGAATRVAPVGLLYCEDVEMLRWVAEEQASITHPHSLGVEGAVMQAMAVALAINAAEMAPHADDFLLELGGECQSRELRQQYESAAGMALKRLPPERVVARLGNGRSALGSVTTAAYCFAAYRDSFEDTLAYAVSLAGNTAAIASMAGAISGAYHGTEVLPQRWLEALERDAVTPERLVAGADALADVKTLL
jgi:poly(ADP-ribose) glycohydrolase ARH3